MGGDAFQNVPVDRRKFVKTVLAASAVTVPVVTSISLGGAAPAFAAGDTPNLSGVPSRGQQNPNRPGGEQPGGNQRWPYSGRDPAGRKRAGQPRIVRKFGVLGQFGIVWKFHRFRINR